MSAGAFYNKRPTRSKWLAPESSAHSDIEVEDDLEEEIFDDDVDDPDFLLDIPEEDLIPTASGKHAQQMFFEGQCFVGLEKVTFFDITCL